MAKDILLSTDGRVGRMWKFQSRTPISNVPVQVPVEVAKEAMKELGAVGVEVFQHNPVNPEEKVTLTEENIENVTFPGNVATEEELIAAVKNADVKNINLTTSIKLTKTLKMAREGIVLDGHGYKVTMSGTGKAIEATKSATLKNLFIEGASDPATWSSGYALHLYGAEFVVENVTLTKMNAAMFCNKATVTLKGKVDMSGNGFGGMEVSADKAILRIQGDLLNTTEKYEKPTMWVDGTIGTSAIYGIEKFTKAVIKNQDQFYLKAANIIVPAPVAPTVTVEGLDTITVGVPAEYSVTTKKGDYAGGNVQGKFVTTAGADLIGKIEYYEVNPAAGEGWKDLSGDTFGPTAGFPMMDATSKFRITATAPGTIKQTINIVEVGTGTIVCSVDAEGSVVAG